MTIHFFTFSGPKGGSSRQRAFRVAEGLQKRGFTAVVHTPPVLDMSLTRWPKKGLLILRTIRSLFSIRKGDIVYLQRAIANKYFFAIMVCYLAIFRRTMIFDFDDPIYMHSYFKTKVFATMADAVIVCTHGQAEWARQFNNNVHIVHIALDLTVYEKFTKDYSKGAPPCVIGWVGTGPEHIHNLKLLVPVFTELLAKKDISFTFRLIGALRNEKVYALFRGIPGLQVEFIDELVWTDHEAVPREIQKFDIGVLPHKSDGEWNKSKSSLKILEYMACGVASVASAFGEMPYVIKDGHDGFLAASPEEWAEKIGRLIADRALRKRLGRAGQECVRECFSFDAVIPLIEEALLSVSNSRS